MNLAHLLYFLLITFAIFGLGYVVSKSRSLAGPIGMGLIMLAAGWITLFSNLPGSTINISVLTIGLVSGLLSYRAFKFPSLGVYMLLLALGLLAWASFNFTIYPEGNKVTWLVPPQLNENDDPTYIHLVNKYLYNGHLIDPFNFRRALSLGGYHVLQSLPMTFLGNSFAYVFDIAIVPIFLWALILVYFSPFKAKSFFVWWVTTLFILIEVPRYNTNASASTVLLVLATLLAVFSNKHPAIIAILLSSAIITRSFSLLFLGLFFLGYMLLGLKPRKWYVVIGVLSSLCLMPWCIHLFLSSNTPLFPPILGNINHSFVNLGSNPADTFLHILHPPLAFLLLSVLILVILDKNTQHKVAYIAGLLTCGYIIIKLGSGDPTEIYRYCFSLLFPCLIIGAKVYLEKGNMVRLAFLTVASIIFLPNIAQATTQKILQIIYTNKPAITNISFQQYIPEGAKILVASDDIYLMDYTKNPIYTLDVLGGASPNNRLASVKSLQDLTQLLAMANIQYVIIPNWEEGALYRKQYWEAPPDVVSNWAPTVLKIMTLLDELALNNPTVETEKHRIITL